MDLFTLFLKKFKPIFQVKITIQSILIGNIFNWNLRFRNFVQGYRKRERERERERERLMNEENEFGFGSDSLFPARELEAVILPGTRGIYNLTGRRTQ